MSSSLSRRKLITSGLAAAAGATGLGVAARLASRYNLIPPDHGGIYGAGETLTYAAQRILMSRHPLAPEFASSEISRIFPIKGNIPEDETYHRLSAGGFADWRLRIDGLVARPSSFSLAELKRFPSRTQITQHSCEEGWSAIGQWTGVPVSSLLNFVGVSTRAKYLVFYPFDTAWGSIDMDDAWHPQTLIAYGMNGGDLSNEHGAPVRLRVARQMGYKSVKFLSHIRVTDTVKDLGKGVGGLDQEYGYSWYAGI